MLATTTSMNVIASYLSDAVPDAEWTIEINLPRIWLPPLQAAAHSVAMRPPEGHVYSKCIDSADCSQQLGKAAAF